MTPVESISILRKQCFLPYPLGDLKVPEKFKRFSGKKEKEFNNATRT